MRRSALAALVAASLAGAAGAHPHAYVDQQVQLSLGLDAADVTLVIVPSVEEGAAIFAHVDGDGDGTVSEEEAQRLGAAVLAGTRLVVDGEPVALAHAATSVAEAVEVRAGSGAITVTARAPLGLAAEGAHRIAFAITFGAFSHDWFVQPFYYPDLTAAFAAPVLERSPEGDRVTIRLEP